MGRNAGIQKTDSLLRCERMMSLLAMYHVPSRVCVQDSYRMVEPSRAQ